jgi:phosphohistidine phosphatase
MRRLLLLRHSKAVPFTGRGDYDRALTERGRADAAQVGEFLAAERMAPAAAVHSGARRTKETLALVLGKLRTKIAVSMEPRLYEASPSAILQIVREGFDETETLLLVGHNPSIAETAQRLTGTGDENALSRLATKYPTSGLAILDFETSHWRDVADGEGRLVGFVTPSTLGDRDD